MTLTETRPLAAPAATRQKALGVGLAVIAGFAVATQARVNGELAVRLDDGLAAAVVSFGSGLLLLTFLVPARAAGRRSLAALGSAVRAGGLRFWQLLGGLSGAFLVATQTHTVAALGVATFTVGMVAGQTASGLAVDRAGLGPGGRQSITLTRLAGAGLTVAAVLIAVGDRLGQPSALALAALPALAGIGTAWQQAVNGRVGVAAGNVLTATFVNFVVGTTALVAAYLVLLVARGGPAGRWPAEPWLYTGGLLGVALIAIAVAVVRLTGVLLLSMGIIAGQVVGAILLDLSIPAAAGQPKPVTLLGAALTVFAVIVAAWRPGRVSRRSRSGPGRDARPGRSRPPRC